MEKVVMQTDVPNANGRVYPKETIQKAISECSGKNLMIYCGVPNDRLNPDLKDAIGTAKLRIEGDDVIADITQLDTPIGLVMEDVWTSSGVRTGGRGTITDGYVTDFQFDYLILTDDPA